MLVTSRETNHGSPHPLLHSPDPPVQLLPFPSLLMKTAQIGSISHGTLRSEDLIDTFFHELESLVFLNGDYFSKPENFAERNKLNNLIGEAQDAFNDEEELIHDDPFELINALMDALEQFAPPYCTFGAHDGDGSDFGFWPSWEAIEELPQIADNSQEAIEAEQSENFSTDVRYLNDHGNTTVYGADGSVLLELV